jgi:DNA-binding transcriptional LysR family regulator
MELRHVRYFIAAAEEQHFGRAAQRLEVSRPAVSQMVADLERELGIALFERRAQRVKLTAAARALLPQFQASVNALQQAVALAKQVADGKAGSLKIGYGSLTLLHPLFRAAVKRLNEACPEVTLSLHELPSPERQKALVDGRIDAGFMHFGPRPAARRRPVGQVPQDATVLDRLRIQSNGLGVAVPHDHPIARRTSVTLSQLRDEAFVVVPHSNVSPGYGTLFALCQKAGFQPRIVQEVGSVASQLNLVSVGMGIGVTITGKDFNFAPNLAVVPLSDVKYTSTYALCWVKGRTEPVLDRLIGIVRELAA